MKFAKSAVCAGLVLNAVLGSSAPSTMAADRAEARSMQRTPNRLDDESDRAADELQSLMRGRAVSQGERQHPFSRVELVERDSFKIDSFTGVRIVVTAEYSVHMIGSLIGADRFLVRVRIQGEITRERGKLVAAVIGTTVLSDTTK